MFIWGGYANYFCHNIQGLHLCEGLRLPIWNSNFNGIFFKMLICIWFVTNINEKQNKPDVSITDTCDDFSMSKNDAIKDNNFIFFQLLD